MSDYYIENYNINFTQVCLPIESAFLDYLSDAGSSIGKFGIEIRDALWKWLNEMEKTTSNSVNNVGSDIVKFPKIIEEVAEKSAAITADVSAHGLEIGGTFVGETGKVITKAGGLLKDHDHNEISTS